jgi:hypothetical protein
MMRRPLLAAGLLVLATAATALADEEPDIEFFYPVVTRRPVVEREIEITARHAKGGDGRETELALGLEWPVLSRWQIELEVPLVIEDPAGGPLAAGPGDVEIQNKVLLWKSVEHRALVSAGVELRLPTGSSRRGLGGELTVEPFAAAGIALGPFDLLADVAYEWGLKDERSQEVSADLALGYPLHRLFTPFLELGTVTLLHSSDEIAGRVQVYLTPGFDVRPLPGMTLRTGVQLPVTRAREHDYVIHGGLVWEF